MVDRIVLFLILMFLPLGAFAEDTITIASLGPVHLYQTSPNPAHTIIIMSGTEGWNGKMVELAKNLAQKNNLVAGVDYNVYMKNMKNSKFTCICGDFMKLGINAQRQRGVKQYSPTVLIGNGEGGKLVYAALAQAPFAFLGGVSFDFCPDYSDIRRMCKTDGVKYVKNSGKNDTFLPDNELNEPWLVVSGPSCKTDVQGFHDKIKRMQLLDSEKNPMEKIEQSIQEWQQDYNGDLANDLGLPLIVYPPPTSGDTLFVILSGDGGWTSLDRDIGDYLSKNGMAVVGFNMLNYLWSDPTPGKGGKDLDKIISYYLARWNRKSAVLIGYSMGADALAFATPRLSENIDRLRGVVLIGPAVRSQFALNFSPENDPKASDGDLLLPHIKKISAPVLCIGGAIERESLCRRAENNKTLPDNVHVELLQTGHTFHDGYEEICSMMSDQFKLDLNIKTKGQP